MIIFLEGLDACGKTTLAKRLFSSQWANKKKAFYTACGKPPKFNTKDELNKWTVSYYWDWCKAIKDLSDSFNVICDRSHYGEAVWGPLYRQTNSDFIWEIEKEMRFYNAKAIFLYDSIENIYTREDEDSLGNQKQKEIELFTSVFNNIKYDAKILYNIQGDFKRMNEDINDFLKDDLQG